MEIRNAAHRLVVDNTDLSNSSFQNANLSGCSYCDCNQSRSNFDDISLRGSTLRNVDLTDVEIKDCNVGGMKIDGVLVADALAAFRQSSRMPAAIVIPGIEGASGIRPFRQDDETAVISLWKSVFGYTAPHNDPATVIRQKAVVDPDLFVVAVESNEIAGTIIGGYDGHRGWIYSLAVDPCHRRERIGSALVRHIEQALTKRGCMKVNLQVFANNADVVSFYERLGFRVEERISMGKLLQVFTGIKSPS